MELEQGRGTFLNQVAVTGAGGQRVWWPLRGREAKQGHLVSGQGVFMTLKNPCGVSCPKDWVQMGGGSPSSGSISFTDALDGERSGAKFSHKDTQCPTSPSVGLVSAWEREHQPISCHSPKEGGFEGPRLWSCAPLSWLWWGDFLVYPE